MGRPPKKSLPPTQGGARTVRDIPGGWATIIAALIGLVAVVIGAWLTTLGGPTDEASACSFRGLVTDDNPVAGAEVGYFAGGAWRTLAVADSDGRFHGSCPDPNEADYPLELVVRRAADYRNCGFPTGTSLEEGRREQRVSVNLDTTPFQCLE